MERVGDPKGVGLACMDKPALHASLGIPERLSRREYLNREFLTYINRKEVFMLLVAAIGILSLRPL